MQFPEKREAKGGGRAHQSEPKAIRNLSTASTACQLFPSLFTPTRQTLGIAQLIKIHSFSDADTLDRPARAAIRHVAGLGKGHSLSPLCFPTAAALSSCLLLLGSQWLSEVDSFSECHLVFECSIMEPKWEAVWVKCWCVRMGQKYFERRYCV